MAKSDNDPEVKLYPLIIEKLLPPENGSTLVLSNVFLGDEQSENRGNETGSYYIPKQLFPSYCELINLPQDPIGFLYQFIQIVYSRKPQNLFFISPWGRIRPDGIFPDRQVWYEKDRQRNLDNHYSEQQDFLEVLKDERLTDSVEDTIPLDTIHKLLLQFDPIIERLDFCELILLIAQKVLPNSSIGTLVPQNILTNDRSIIVRQSLLEDKRAKFILEQDHAIDLIGIPGIFRQFRACTVLIMPSNTSSIAFFKTEEGGDITRAIRNLIRLKNGNKVVENGFWLEGEVSSEDPLTYDYLNPEGLKTFEDFSNSLGGTRKLTDLVDFVGTYQYAIFKSGVIETEEDYDFHVPEGYAGILDAKGLSVTGDIDIRSIHKSILIDYIRKDSLIRKGDILIRQINNFEQQETLFVAIVDDLPSPLIASNSIIVLRPKAGVAPTQLKLLISFLKGRHTLERIKAHGSRFHLSRSILERFSVPEPDLAISEAIESLDAAEKAHIDWIKELSQVRDEIFSIPDSREKRLRLLSETRRVRQKYAAANTVDDFASRVRRYFPHPIAYRWTMIETRERDYEGYKHILECTEVTIAYLASIGILLAKKYGKVITVVRDEATKLGRNNTHGKTFGYWIKVLEDVRSLLRDADQSIPFYEITRFPKTFADDQLGLNAERAISYLTKSRNSDAHFQGPKGFEVQSVYQEAYDKLQLVLQGAEFLTEYPLIYIEKTRLDTLTNLTHYQYRELMGDQHLVPIHNKVSTRTDLEAESLYLQDREGELHCLRPMLLSRAAAKENRRATFYLNQYSPQENTCTLRSLELGDTVFDLDVSQYVQSGLITPEQKTHD